MPRLEPEPIPVVLEQTLPNHGYPAPKFISQEEDDKPPQPRYNLRKRKNLINSIINPSIIPGIHINRQTQRSTHGLAASNQALQMCQLHSTMTTNYPEDFANSIIDKETGKYLEFRHLMKLDKYRKIWTMSFANKLGRLSQGIRDIPGADTINFIPHANVPAQETVTYGQMFCTYRPQKDEK